MKIFKNLLSDQNSNETNNNPAATSPVSASTSGSHISLSVNKRYLIAALILAAAVALLYFTKLGDFARSRTSTNNQTSLEEINAINLSQSTAALEVDTSIQTIDAAEISGPIGVVGCSNTIQHTFAYGETSDEDKLWAWETIKGYSGGTMNAWNNEDNRRWDIFKDNYNAVGTNAVWVQLCIRDSQSSGMAEASESQKGILTSLIDKIKAITGEVPIIVSPLNGFTEGDCAATGPYGQLNSVDLANWAASEGLAYRGPDTGPLDHSQLNNDLCHLNDAGVAFVGPQMAGYFDDGVAPPIPDPEPDPNPEPDPEPDPNPEPDPEPDPTSPISIAPEPPISAGQSVVFTDNLESSTKRRWYFGDGTGSITYSNSVSKIYSNAGTYTVMMEYRDEDGVRQAYQVQIVVQ